MSEDSFGGILPFPLLLAYSRSVSTNIQHAISLEVQTGLLDSAVGRQVSSGVFDVSSNEKKLTFNFLSVGFVLLETIIYFIRLQLINVMNRLCDK